MENIHFSTSILQLSEDCLYIILGKLSSSSDRDSFGLTCRRWFNIQNLSRRSLHFECSLTHLDRASLSRPSMDINASHLSRLLRRFSQLEFLNLSGCTNFPDSGLSVFLNSGLKLQRLCLDCCFGISDTGLSYVARGCPSLKMVSLYMCNITDLGLKTLSESCLSLQDLNISYCSRITDKGIRYLSRNCRELRAVNISRCRGINGIGFQECSGTFTCLEAASCRLEPEGISAIMSGGGLEYLNISSLHWSIRGNGIASIDGALMSKLKVINFRLCRSFGDDEIMHIAVGCPLLQEWNLALCHQIRLSGWMSIGINCCNLEILHVNRCQNICEQGLQALRDGCKRLRRLHLGGCAKISEVSVEMFKYVRSNVHITDEEIIYIEPSCSS